MLSLSDTATKRVRTAIFLVAAVAIFYNLGGGSFKDWDEALTAERAREILIFNDWLTLHWNYQIDLVKPPLYYWLTAPVYQALGVHEFAARLWSALFGLLGLYAVYRLGTVLFSIQVGVTAALLLLTVSSYINSARAAMLDTGLLSFGTLALCAFLVQDFVKGWMLLALGFLLKGPWVLFYLFALPFWWLTQRDWSALRHPRLYLGALLFLALVLPWHLAQYRLYGETFFNFYVGYQIATRLQQPIEGHAHEVLFYLKKLSAKWHIWFYWLVLGHTVVAWRGKDGSRLAFLTLWMATILLILTFIIKTKMTKYAMPLYPAIAVMTGYCVLYAVQRFRWGVYALVVSGIIAVAHFLTWYDYTLDFNPEEKAVGQIVQRHTTDLQPVLTFRVLQQPTLVFYCRRFVYPVWEADALIRTVQPGSVVLITPGDAVLSLLTQRGFIIRSLFEGSRYALVILSRPGKE